MSRTARAAAAYPYGVDPAALSRTLHRAHDDFLVSGEPHSTIRPVVLDSWRRSLGHGIDPERASAPVGIADDQLEVTREQHRLAEAMPVIRRLLVESAADAGLLVAVSDAAGRLLWVEGHAGLRSRAEGMHFVEGADWSEAAVGTNAPGTALELDDAVAILGAEHLSRQVTPWSCSAAPIHDPISGSMLGVLDVTGGNEVASSQSLSLVRATVAAVESELRFSGLMTAGRDYATTGATAQLDVLGVHQGTLDDGIGPMRLSLRHSEILVLLADAADGLTADELSVLLGGQSHAPVTVRAEMSRLRSALHPVELESRPYRIEGTLRTDIDVVNQRLEAGDLHGAIEAYRGPVLPQSRSPGVVSIRDELHSRLDEAVHASGDHDAIVQLAAAVR